MDSIVVQIHFTCGTMRMKWIGPQKFSGNSTPAVVPKNSFHYDGRPTPPLRTYESANVIYIGTLSKVLVPRLRQGFVVGPTTFIERVIKLRRIFDRQGDSPIEAAIAEMIEDGEVATHAKNAHALFELQKRFGRSHRNAFAGHCQRSGA
jgi:aspartate/methionine/tyrosine aminotransferase